MKDLSRRKFLTRAAVAVPAAAIAVPLAIKAVEAHVVEAPPSFLDLDDAPSAYDNPCCEIYADLTDVEPNEVVGNYVDDNVTCAFSRVEDPKDIHLWCRKEAGDYYWVINGHWDYDPTDPQWPESIKVWEGVAPFGDGRYNEAMAWIREQVA